MGNRAGSSPVIRTKQTPARKGGCFSVRKDNRNWLSFDGLTLLGQSQPGFPILGCGCTLGYFCVRENIPYRQLPKRRLFSSFPQPLDCGTFSTAALALAKNHLKIRSFRCKAFLRWRNRRLRYGFCKANDRNSTCRTLTGV